MEIIGITGQTGAGKSTVCREIEKLGFYHIDADVVARELTQRGSPVIPELCRAFGGDILCGDGSINRRLLAERAFSSKEKTLLLNSITHPAITEKIREIINKKQTEDRRGVLIDAIALFESGESELCSFTLAVTAPKELRLERIMKRDGISRQDALLRADAQQDEDFYRKNADFIIENYPPHDISVQIKRIFDNEQAKNDKHT